MNFFTKELGFFRFADRFFRRDGYPKVVKTGFSAPNFPLVKMDKALKSGKAVGFIYLFYVNCIFSKSGFSPCGKGCGKCGKPCICNTQSIFSPGLCIPKKRQKSGKMTFFTPIFPNYVAVNLSAFLVKKLQFLPPIFFS